MKNNFDIQSILNSPCGGRNQHLVTEVRKKIKRSKYNNKKCVVDGIEFDSQREADRYCKLKNLLKVGEIGLLELQKEFELNEGGTYSYKYYADFVYVDARTGERIVEDCKGARTTVYKKKKKLMKKIYGIEIKET